MQQLFLQAGGACYMSGVCFCRSPFQVGLKETEKKATMLWGPVFRHLTSNPCQHARYTLLNSYILSNDHD